MDINSAELAKQLERIYQEQAVTWNDIAIRSGLSLPTIFNFIKGQKVSPMTLKKIQKYISKQ